MEVRDSQPHLLSLLNQSSTKAWGAWFGTAAERSSRALFRDRCVSCGRERTAMDSRRMVPRRMSTTVNFTYEELECNRGRSGCDMAVGVSRKESKFRGKGDSTGHWRRYSYMTTVRCRGRASV